VTDLLLCCVVMLSNHTQLQMLAFLLCRYLVAPCLSRFKCASEIALLVAKRNLQMCAADKPDEWLISLMHAVFVSTVDVQDGVLVSTVAQLSCLLHS